ncbi:MAG: hypothetical protein IJH76_04455 [Clostridia bacterium]|nr:hypothetical protein [Clostridia bacterium]
MFKNQKGITLIALVITIIVLLILAGITIALITSNESAPNKAGEAKIIQDVGAAKDAVTLNATNLMTTWYEEKYVNNTAQGTSSTAGGKIVAGVTENSTTTYPVLANLSGVYSKVGTTSTSGKAGTITLKSVATRSSDGLAYQVVGTVDNGGTISWADGTWETAGNFTA